MELIIRKSISGELADLRKIAKETILATHHSFLGEEAVDGFLNTDKCEQYLVDHLTNSWSMVLDGNMIGFAVDKENLIDLLMVDHTFHRKGYGTRLLTFMENKLAKTNKELVLECFEDNIQANQFFTKNKWIETERYLDPTTNQNKIKYTKTIPEIIYK